MEKKERENTRRREERKKIEIPKLENPSTVEDYISQLILSLLPYCTYNSISQGSERELPSKGKAQISRNTIKNHLKQGNVPPELFDSYIKAFRKLEPSNIELGKGQNDGQQKEAMEKYLAAYCDLLELVNESYKVWKKLPYNLISSELYDENFAQKYSNRFWYLLNKCFEAIRTLNYYDVLFLNKFFKSGEDERQKIVKKLNDSEANSHFAVIEAFLHGGGNLWLGAYKEFSSDTKKKSTKEQKSEAFREKLKDMATVERINKETNRIARKALEVMSFLALIWPGEGETDTKFGPKEIEALIVFKYFLTDEAQKKLLTELQIDYT